MFPYCFGNNGLSRFIRMNAVVQEHVGTIRKTIKQKGNERSLICISQFGEDVSKSLSVPGAIVRRDLHASQHRSGAIILDKPNHLSQILAGGIKGQST